MPKSKLALIDSMYRFRVVSSLTSARVMSPFVSRALQIVTRLERFIEPKNVLMWNLSSPLFWQFPNPLSPAAPSKKDRR